MGGPWWGAVMVSGPQGAVAGGRPRSGRNGGWVTRGCSSRCAGLVLQPSTPSDLPPPPLPHPHAYAGVQASKLRVVPIAVNTTFYNPATVKGVRLPVGDLVFGQHHRVLHEVSHRV